MSANVNLNLHGDVTKPLEKATEGTTKGLGRLFSCFFGKWEANNQRYQALSEAQTEQDCKAIQQGNALFRDGNFFSLPIVSTGSLILDAERSQKSQNLYGNLKVAYEVLKDIPDYEIPDEEVDPDFIARWRREAKVIGKEELQSTWGRILAEEIKTPGSISYRTLDIVKNMTVEEANLFVKVAPFVCDGRLIMKFPEKSTFIPYTYSDLCVLEACGLISGGVDDTKIRTIYEVTITKENTDHLHYVFLFNGLSVFSEVQNRKMSLSGSFLTKAAKELYGIVTCNKFPQEGIETLMNTIRVEGKQEGKITAYLSNKRVLNFTHPLYERDLSKKISDLDELVSL